MGTNKNLSTQHYWELIKTYDKKFSHYQWIRTAGIPFGFKGLTWIQKKKGSYISP